ncbi:hypothetical protein [Streptomyces sp. IBSBF 3136]
MTWPGLLLTPGHINRLKGFGAVATRYEKRAYTYLGTFTLAGLIIWLRT